MVNENCVASVITALTQTDSDAWCKRALSMCVVYIRTYCQLPVHVFYPAISS